jgi:ABC-type sugar transport system permease subunit
MSFFKDENGELRNYVFIFLWILLCFVLFLLIVSPIAFYLYYSFQKTYAGKTVNCIEDNGAEFTAVVENSFDNFFWFYENGKDGLQFKGTDGIIYKCRGIVKAK